VKSSKPLLAVLGAIVVLGMLTGAASAGRLSINREFIAPGWTTASFTGGFGTVECELVLISSFHTRTITKTTGSLVGFIVGAEIPRCRRGSATLLVETLPWHVRYFSFSGTLPGITRVSTQIIGFALQIREPTFGILCLARSTEAEPAFAVYNVSFGRISSVSLGGGIRTSCGSAGALSGTSAIIERVTISLI